MTSAADRFWAKVDKTGDCWVWTAYKDQGYGIFKVTTSKTEKAHRWAYVDLVGPIPSGFHLDHLCHDPAVCPGGDTCPHRACVNPAHLKAGTQAENNRADRNPGNGNYLKTHCPRDHEYTEENTRYRNGRRECRACIRVRDARRHLL